MTTHVAEANEVAGKLAETTRESYQAVVDHAVGIQERNVRFGRGILDDPIEDCATRSRATGR